MLDIYIAASLTTGLALTIIGVPLMRLVDKDERGLLALLVVLMLPLHVLAFFLLRVPLDNAVMATLPVGFHSLLSPWYAALTEEPVKLAPLLLAWFAWRMKTVNPGRLALAIGLGFGIGEAWTIAGLLANVPTVAQYPWYALTGYVGERLLFCILHAGFTAVALHFILQHKQIMRGIALAVLLHFLANLPTFLAAAQAFNFSLGTWNLLLQVWSLLWLVLAGLILAHLTYGKQWPGKFAGWLSK